jgi:thiol-disulfide isomerase/thioredoxin
MIGLLLLMSSVISAQSDDLAIIEYSAPWCHVCEEMKPLVKSAQAAGYNLVVANIDQKKYDSFPGRNSNDSIPFFVVVDKKSKKVLAVSPPGSMEPQEFKNFVKKYLKPKEKK